MDTLPSNLNRTLESKDMPETNEQPMFIEMRKLREENYQHFLLRQKLKALNRGLKAAKRYNVKPATVADYETAIAQVQADIAALLE